MGMRPKGYNTMDESVVTGVYKIQSLTPICTRMLPREGRPRCVAAKSQCKTCFKFSLYKPEKDKDA